MNSNNFLPFYKKNSSSEDSENTTVNKQEGIALTQHNKSKIRIKIN